MLFRSLVDQCFLIDQLVRLLFDFVAEHIYPLANPTEGEKLAVVAVGGYGRGEMAPYSDVDLLFLTPYKRTPHTEQVVGGANIHVVKENGGNFLLTNHPLP